MKKINEITRSKFRNQVQKSNSISKQMDRQLISDKTTAIEKKMHDQIALKTIDKIGNKEQKNNKNNKRSKNVWIKIGNEE